MSNWKVVPASAALDTNNPANIVVTFTATNSVTNEALTFPMPCAANADGTAWTDAQINSAMGGILNNLLIRDNMRALAAGALADVQARVAAGTLSAQG